MDARIERAIQAADDGDTNEAIGLLKQVLRSDPDSEDAWLWMANLASSERQRRLALRQVLRINPDNQTAWEMLTDSGEEGPGEPPPEEVAEQAAVVAAAALNAGDEDAVLKTSDQTAAPEVGDDEAATPEASDEAAAPEVGRDEGATPEEHDDETASPSLIAAAVAAEAAGEDAVSESDEGDGAPEAIEEDDEPTLPAPPGPEELEPLPAPPPDAPVPPPAYEPWDDSEPRPWLPLLIALLVAACIVVSLLAGVLYAPRLQTEAGPTPTLALIGPTSSEFDTAAEASGDAALTPTVEPEGAFSTGPQAPLPDLVVRWVRIELETDSDCMEPGAELGTTVAVGNSGENGAAPFALEVNGTIVDVPTGLAAGEQTFVWVPGYTSGAETHIQVDAASEVEESDEENNTYGEFVPIPTPLPTCAPPSETAPSGAEPTPEAETGAPGDFDVPPISVANAASLAPVRITARSDYTDGPTSFLQFEVDEQGSVRVAVDTPDGLEEWLVIDGVTYAGEASAEGLIPYQAVEDPLTVAGFSNPFDLFAPRGDSDRFATAFPLQAVLWWGTPERTDRQGTEPIHGLPAEEYSIAVKPEGTPQEAYVGKDRTEDLAAAVSTGDPAPPVTLWVEPESGAILQAEWSVDLPSGARAQYRLDVSPVGVGPFALPPADMPNPAAQHCAQEGYTTEIRTEEAGEVGYCVFANGTACEEWAFYRGECTPEDAQPLAEATAEPAVEETPTAVAAAGETPEQAAATYWDYIGDGRLMRAWALLSPAFQKREYNSSLKDFRQYQRGLKICDIDLTEITKDSGDADEAAVTVRLAVRKGNDCTEREWIYQNRLVADPDQGTWLIADATRIE